MDSTSKFCGECGVGLYEGAGFCGECGTPVAVFENQQRETVGSSSGTAQNKSKPISQKKTKSNSDKIKTLAIIFVLLLLVFLFGGLSLLIVIAPIVLFIVFVWVIWRVRCATRNTAKEKD